MPKRFLRTLAAVALFMLIPLAAGAAEARVPMRYLVMEIDANDVVTLVSSKRVSMAADPSEAAEPTSRFRTRAEADAIEASLIGHGGAVLARQLVLLERELRAEFAASPEGSIDGRRIPLARTVFAVRLPASEATFVDLEPARSGRRQRFAVSEIDRRARLQSDGVSESSSAEVRPAAVSSANRLDLLVIGDGYTAAESASFYKDVERIVGSFLSVEPYATYGNYVVISTLFVPSLQSGADHPPCDDGGPDPREGTFVDTAFDATYCTSGLQRLLTVNSGKVFAAAAAVPDWDKIIVIVNDSMYGGAGGTFSVSSTHENGVDILQHEYGHSFTRLADEYATPYPSYPSCSDAAGAPCEANVTDVADRGGIKWRRWILPATPIPTAWPHVDVIGLFEGARYKSTGMYRPKHDCLMNHLGQPFCSVCSEAYVMRLYSGWNGVPAGGISLIEPGTESPAQSELTIGRGTSVTFSAQILQPPRGGITSRWLVDGVEVPGVVEPSFVFVAESNGTHVIELRVSDGTPLVLPATAAGTGLTKTRKWTVNVTGPVPPKRRSVRF